MARLLSLAVAAALSASGCGEAVSDARDTTFMAESTADAVPKGARDVTIPAGTMLPMTLTRSLSSDANVTGDRVTAELTRALSIDGHEVLARGTRLEGRVTAVLDRHAGERGPMITFHFTRLQTRGQQHDVRTVPLSHPPPATTGDAPTRAVRLLPGADVSSELTAPLTVRIPLG